MADTRLAIPILTSKDHYDIYKQDVSMWESVTMYGKAKQAPLLALYLPKDRRLVYDGVTVKKEDLEKATGIATLINCFFGSTFC